MEGATREEADSRGNGASEKPPLSFLTGDELLCLLPAPVAPAAGIGVPAQEDPAAAARNARPLTAAAVKEVVAAAEDPVLEWLTRISLALAPYAARSRFRIGLCHLISISTIIPFLWIAGIPYGFGRKQLVATTVAFSLECAFYSLLATNIGWFAGRRSGARPAPSKEDDPEGGEAAGDSPVPGGFFAAATLDVWPDSSFWRYLILCQSGAPRNQLFLMHIDADGSNCCCPRKSCAGSVASRAGLVRSVTLAFFSLVVLLSYVTKFFTAMVTLGGQMWTTAWTLAGILWILSSCNNEFVSTFGGAGTSDNLAARELERKLTVRAVRRSLEALVERLQGLVEGPADAKTAACERWYASLVPLLAARWRQDVLLPQYAALAGVFFIAETTAFIIYVTTGNCVPVYVIALLLMGYSGLMYPLFNAAVGNGRITQTTALLRSASLSLSELELACTEAQQPLARRIAAHRARLRDLEEVHVDGAGVRLFGARVTASLVRKIMAATVTAVFAAWTVLRALGVVLTMEMVCPATS